MGDVWRAYDTSTERVVAVKVLPTEYVHDPQYQERFRREARSAASLDEPHVVPIYDFGEIAGRLFVAMRLIRGKDLQAILDQGALDPHRAVKIVEQIASALYAAHRIGLFHRDVKPHNILVAEDDFAYLIDFGIARTATDSRLTATGRLIGTPAYMAPERFKDGTADATADTYALTCVLYQALTARLPFPARDPQQMIAAHLLEPPPKPTDFVNKVPSGMDAVVATGLAKDPRNRFLTAKDLAQAARAALETPRPSPTLPSTRPRAEAKVGGWRSRLPDLRPGPTPHEETFVLRYAARSDRGLVNPNNQDSVYAGARLLAVADGAAHAGEVASQLTIASLAHLDDEEPDQDLQSALYTAAREGNAAIAEHIREDADLDGMSTTLTAILFARRKIGLIHLGASRCYLLRRRRLTQLTEDDGRALAGRRFEPTLLNHEVREGDRYLLCTRGLSDPVSQITILDALRIADGAESADRLIEMALRGGGPDNVTAIVADVLTWSSR